MMKAASRDQSRREITENFPIAIADIPATKEQRRLAAHVIAALLIVAASVAPFAKENLGPVSTFIPTVQTVIAVADLTTAILIFAQFSVVQRPALLALASSYLCSASFAFLQTLSFPGGHAPNGIIGDGLNSPAWFFVLWHVTFPLGILIYAFSPSKRAARPATQRSSTGAIVVTVAFVATTIIASACLVTAGVAYLPVFYATNIVEQTRLGNQVNIGFLLWYSVALIVLLARRRTTLDVWIGVVLVAWLPSFAVAAMASSVRFSVGWYVGRGFAFVASLTLLAVLLTEMTVLYSRLANAFLLLRREGNNRLMSVDAATAAMAHEVRSPLTTIGLNAATALIHLRSKPPALDEADVLVNEIAAETARAAEVISSVRAIFQNTSDGRTNVLVEDLVREAVRLAGVELHVSQVRVNTIFLDGSACVHADHTQLHQVLLNLIRNGIEAMSSIAPGFCLLELKTAVIGSSAVISVRDSGCGVPAEDVQRVFEAFYTTKRSGMGLGLAISRTIVESHGGSLELVESSANGSVFEVTLPLSG